MIVWHSDHIRSKIICEAFHQGLRNNGVPSELRLSWSWKDGSPACPSAAYGVLRGTDKIYWACQEQDVDWWNVDRGFFRAEHFDGYYRIGYRHLQPTYRDVDLDPSRWESHGLRVAPDYVKRDGGYILICPPTRDMSLFYRVDVSGWLRHAMGEIPWRFRKRLRVRDKLCRRSLEEDLKGATGVVAFNSNVAMLALMQGIPAVTETGLVASWNGLGPSDIGTDRVYEHDRMKLFRFAAWTQFTVDEISSGFAWKTISSIYQRRESSEPLRNDA